VFQFGQVTGGDLHPTTDAFAKVVVVEDDFKKFSENNLVTDR
jgi:hypothetical protein